MAIEYFDSRQRAIDYLNQRLGQGFQGTMRRLGASGGMWVVTWRAK